ncbi:MAG TPA: DedA family protein [Alphaproteobacteria bacterium]|nr:DedA family protein [Alphaproteobacteria bacterium]
MTEWLTGILDHFGYVGIFLMLALARSVPPIPAETVVPLAGVAAAQGQFNLALVALAGGLGSAVGELVWYLPARILGRERLTRFLQRYGHWLTVSPAEVERATAWFERHGGIAVLLCQPLPALRTMVSIPAGACRMPVPRFLLYGTVGSSLFIFLLAGAGYLLQAQTPRIGEYLGYFATAVFVTLIALYLYRLTRQLRARRARLAE